MIAKNVVRLFVVNNVLWEFSACVRVGGGRWQGGKTSHVVRKKRKARWLELLLAFDMGSQLRVFVCACLFW